MAKGDMAPVMGMGGFTGNNGIPGGLQNGMQGFADMSNMFQQMRGQGRQGKGQGMMRKPPMQQPMQQGDMQGGPGLNVGMSRPYMPSFQGNTGIAGGLPQGGQGGYMPTQGANPGGLNIGPSRMSGFINPAMYGSIGRPGVQY